MAQISRLHEDEIQNGNLIDADDLNPEFDQLVNESNDQDTRIDNLESGNITIDGVKTFSSAPKTDQINEKTTGNGVNVGGVVLKSGTLNAVLSSDPASPTDGAIWYNSTLSVLKMRLGGQTKTLSDPANYMSGPTVAYVSASSIKIPAGFQCRSATDDFNIAFASDTTVSIASSGANGLDTGSEASSTWYYLWAIGDSSGTHSPAGLLSVSSTSPTMPTGYDKKRLLPIAIKNDGSSNFLPFRIIKQSGFLMVIYTTFETTASWAALSAGTATTFTAVSLASFVPPISRLALVQEMGHYVSSSVSNQVRETGSGVTTGIQAPAGASGFTTLYGESLRTLNTSQQYDYVVGASAQQFSIYVRGFVVTEVI